MNRSKALTTAAFALALLVNLGLFTLIPLLVRNDIPRELPLRLQPVRIFQEQPPEPVTENKPPQVEEKPPEPIQTPQPAMPSAPRLIQAPEMSFSMPQATVQMRTGFAPVPVAMADIYSQQDLDRAPTLSHQVPPQYPYRARRMNISGKVEIQFEVGRDGSVSQIEILDSTPPGVFDDAVLAAVRRWRFQPGELMGDAVRTRMTRTIVFNLEESR